MRTLIVTIAFVAAAILLADSNARAEEPLPKIEISDRTAEPLLKSEKQWESFTMGYCRVIRMAETDWRMWYIAFDAATYKGDADFTLCYATSKDGVHWERPDLGIVEYNGSKHNNILAVNDFGSGVFVDTKGPASERFKCVYGLLLDGSWCMFGGTSPDGIHWTAKPGLLLHRHTDTDNVCFFDESAGVYRFYIRMWTNLAETGGKRVVGYLESKTFTGPLNPDARRVVLAPDDKDPKDLHYYNNAAAKVGDSLYVMFPSGFTTGDDQVRVHAALSRDGVTWHRAGRTAVLDLGKTFDKCGLYVAASPVPTGKPNEWWFYYTGTDVPHDQTLPGKVHFGGGVGRFKVRFAERPGR